MGPSVAEIDMRICFLVGLALVTTPAYCDEERYGLVEYRNGIWWDGRSEFRGSRFVVDGRFVESGQSSAHEVIDLDGAIVLAPFGEGHNHDIARPMFEQANRGYLRNGVFYVKNPSAYPPAVAAIRSALNRVDTVDASITFGALTSPGGHPVPLYVEFLSDELYGSASYDDLSGLAFHEVTTGSEVISALDALIAQEADFAKVMLLYSEDFDRGYQRGLDPALLPPLVQEAHKRGLSVSLHVESAEDFRRGVEAGVDEIAHLPGGMIWDQDRAAEEGLLMAEDARRAAESSIAVVTTTLVQVSDDEGIEPSRRDEWARVQRENLGALLRAGVEIRIGSDTRNTSANENGANPTRREAEYLVALGQFDNEEVLARWIDTGRSIFPQRRIGCFEAGCEASFLVFEADPRDSLANLDSLIMAVKQSVHIHPQDADTDSGQ